MPNMFSALCLIYNEEMVSGLPSEQKSKWVFHRRVTQQALGHGQNSTETWSSLTKWMRQAAISKCMLGNFATKLLLLK